MRLSSLHTTGALLLIGNVAASSWFSTAPAYNKWHETELERWLSDHNVPYPTPYDRKQLQKEIKGAWDKYLVHPYNEWETPQLSKFLAAQGQEVSDTFAKNKDYLVEQVKLSYANAGEKSSEAYGSTRDWIFDTWTESQLKKFCDKNGIPVPQPRTRDSLLKTVRENYQSAATKLSEQVSYPGNWLYDSWTESDLKSWCDERGIPVYQGSDRNQLIANVRRNSYSASSALSKWRDAAASQVESASASISALAFESWSDSKLKKWADENGVKVPQGSTRDQVIAHCRRGSNQLSKAASRQSASGASAYGAATSAAGNEYSRATEDAGLKYGYYRSVVGEYVGGYVDWAKGQVGMASAKASSSASGMAAQASKSAASASKSAASVLSKAQQDASAASRSASKSAQKAYDAATESAQKAKDYAKEEL